MLRKKIARKSIEIDSPNGNLLRLVVNFEFFSNVKKVRITRVERKQNVFWFLIIRSKKQLIANMDLGGGGGDGYHRKSSK